MLLLCSIQIQSVSNFYNHTNEMQQSFKNLPESTLYIPNSKFANKNKTFITISDTRQNSAVQSVTRYWIGKMLDGKRYAILSLLLQPVTVGYSQ